MKSLTSFAAGLAVVLFSAGLLSAGEVTVSGVHLCCGACVKAVGAALKDVAGVTNAACDSDAGTVKFTAADEKSAAAGISALAKAGFGGTAKDGDKSLAFPGSGVEKGKKVSMAQLKGIHLCCGGCYKAAEGALKGVNGVTAVKSDKADKTIWITGDNVDLQAALDALTAEGFHATVGVKVDQK